MNSKSPIRKPTVIDLFCGCGGMSLGFSSAGFDVLVGVDNWNDAIRTYNHTHKGSKGLVADLFVETPEQICVKTGVTEIDVIIGGPPCQGFSIAGKRDLHDERNLLYKAFVSFVGFYKPKAFVLENVPNIMSIGKGIVKDNIIADFERLGYNVAAQVLLASNYGVPQNRKRAFFVGVRTIGQKFSFPQPINDCLVNVEEAISDLPMNSLADGSKYESKPMSQYQRQIRRKSKGVYNHQTSHHTEQTVRIISLVPDGGNYKDLPLGLQGTRNVNIAWTRLNSKRPSFTIDTGHRHHFHYMFNRVPTVRESARIQSFPDSFIFLGSKTSQYKQVGNAVPPLLAEVIAKRIMHLI